MHTPALPLRRGDYRASRPQLYSEGDLVYPQDSVSGEPEARDEFKRGNGSLRLLRGDDGVPAPPGLQSTQLMGLTSRTGFSERRAWCGRHSRPGGPSMAWWTTGRSTPSGHGTVVLLTGREVDAIACRLRRPDANGSGACYGAETGATANRATGRPGPGDRDGDGKRGLPQDQGANEQTASPRISGRTATSVANRYVRARGLATQRAGRRQPPEGQGGPAHALSAVDDQPGGRSGTGTVLSSSTPGGPSARTATERVVLSKASTSWSRPPV